MRADAEKWKKVGLSTLAVLSWLLIMFAGLRGAL